MQTTSPRRYSYFQALWMSFFSGDLYRDVGQRWQGWGGLYLMLTVLLYLVCMIAILLWYGTLFYQGRYEEGKLPSVPSAIETMLEQMPALRLKDGKIATPEPKPYYINEPYAQSRLITIDTTGAITTLEQADTPVLVTANDLIYQKDRHEEVYHFKDIEKNLREEIHDDTIELDRLLKNVAHEGLAWVEEHPVKLCVYIGLFMLIFMLPFYFGFLAVLALIWYGIVSYITANVQKLPLQYLDCVRIACVAMTPLLAVKLFELLFMAKGLNWAVSLLLGAVVMVLATLANKRTAE